MNLKTAKQIRRTARWFGIAWDDKQYQALRFPMARKPDAIRVRLNPAVGRALYKDLKRLHVQTDSRLRWT